MKEDYCSNYGKKNVIYHKFVLELFSTKFSYHSAITIKNITNKFDGKYLCIVIDSNDHNVLKKSYSLKVNSKFYKGHIFLYKTIIVM